MNPEIVDGIRADSVANYIDIPLSSWTPKQSYLVCRGLVDNGIVPGKVVIGAFRERVFESFYEDHDDGYAVVHFNYAWIDAGENGVIDPCRSDLNHADQRLFHSPLTQEYHAPIDPLEMKSADLPPHYAIDELFPLKRGLHKEVVNRLLGYKVEVAGLTMIEAAYLATLPVLTLGDNAKMIYLFLMQNNLNKLIPIDNVEKFFPRLARVSPQLFQPPAFVTL
ncbi:hypothetical protein ACLI07_23120 (plasmid) [Providencia huaxiensis]|uniref:Uncharacterized protein n=6 Tax=Enterobacterales TaxID=91347 RepID=A0A7L8KA46_ECOLX|nr:MULTISPECIES: hypothetical protein [Enterobacterales]ELB1214871.1 hypothetical protein [Proteus mirabilis]ELY4881513.1 hypothetical protein [Morganella morganii]SPY66547.1 Uncharacterised protein [Providencia stuartii]ELR5094312.1 hypothetical protein [Providencia rettgeri]ELR5243161.1 hypothetical protein [Providencia rettgeri]